MTGHRRLTKSLDNLDAIKRNNDIEFPGILGSQFKGQSLVEVPNRDGYVYVRLRSNLNEILQAYNSNVSPVFGLPVIVIRDSTANRYIVKGRDLGQYANWGGSAYLPRHGSQHSFPDDNWGGDVVWVYDRQYVPLSISPVSGTSTGHVFVNPDVYYWNGDWLYAGAVETPDLLPYKPTGTTAKLILVYLDVSGSVQIAEGSGFDVSYTTTAQIIPYLPAIPGDGVVPLGAVRLVSGTSTISWTEIYDLRPIVAGNDYPAPYLVQDEGVTRTRRSYMNFVGSGVVATDDSGNDATLITIQGQTGSAGHVIQNEGAGITQRGNLNFLGTTIWAVDNPGNNATDIIISGSMSYIQSIETGTTKATPSAVDAWGVVIDTSGTTYYLPLYLSKTS